MPDASPGTGQGRVIQWLENQAPQGCTSSTQLYSMRARVENTHYSYRQRRLKYDGNLRRRLKCRPF